MDINMNFFEMIFKLTHKRSSLIWDETDATFTGKVEKALLHSKSGFYEASYNAFQIRYYAGDKLIYASYPFYPLPDPDPDELRGKKLRIRYKKLRPHVFEAVQSASSSSE